MVSDGKPGCGIRQAETPEDGSMTSSQTRPATHHRFRPSSAALGQATVEFALVSIIFLTLVLASVDLGRAVYMYSQLTNSVREGARYAQVSPTDTTGIKDKVVSYSSGLGIDSSDVTVSCNTSCTTGNSVTVSVSMPFSLVAQSFLGISPMTLHAHARVNID
jgi:Flp pilus assembly protein TadG